MYSKMYRGEHRGVHRREKEGEERPEETLMEFFNIINHNDYNLKFTITHDPNTLTFSDVQVIRNPVGKLTSTLFRKSTARNTVLHSSSFHPMPLKKSIPYGQYLRVRRNCSSDAQKKLKISRNTFQHVATVGHVCAKYIIKPLPNQELNFCSNTRLGITPSQYQPGLSCVFLNNIRQYEI